MATVAGAIISLDGEIIVDGEVRPAIPQREILNIAFQCQNIRRKEFTGQLDVSEFQFRLDVEIRLNISIEKVNR